MTDSNRTITLKESAYKAISKHARKIFKCETTVLKDKNPENLHQMRMGIRRLRSVIAEFSLAIDLPQITEKDIAKIGRSLGKLRDLDVLLAALTDDYRPLLPTKEQKRLDKAIKSLKKQRKQEVKQVHRTLNRKSYIHFKQELQNWLEQPQYKAISNLSIYTLLPDLLLPQISQLLIHPGWWVGVEIKEGQVQFPQILNQEAVKQLSSREDLLLHDLRKLAKTTRYNLELFSQFYGEKYHHYLDLVKQIQEVLGQIQDAHVLRKVLEEALRSEITNRMPELANLLLQTRYCKWLEWKTLQKQFLEDKTRTEFRHIIQQPL